MTPLRASLSRPVGSLQGLQSRPVGAALQGGPSHIRLVNASLAFKTSAFACCVVEASAVR